MDGDKEVCLDKREQAERKLVHIQLDGVGFHTAMYAACLGSGLTKVAEVHKRQACSEYGELLASICRYVRLFGKAPTLTMPDPGVPSVLADEGQAEEVYREKELGTLERLKACYSCASDKAAVAKKMGEVAEELSRL